MVAQNLNDQLALLNDIYQTLDIVSDGCCPCKNGNKYISFDALKTHFCRKFHVSELTSSDMLYIDIHNNHLIFIEFKDLSKVNNPQAWFRRKEKQYNIMLKMTDSPLLLSKYITHTTSVTHSDYFSTKQSFVLVYKSKTYREKIHQHLSNNMQRYKFLYRNINTWEATAFLKWLP